MEEKPVEEIVNRVEENNTVERIKRRKDKYTKQRNLKAQPTRCYIREMLEEKDVVKAATNIVTITEEKHESFTILKNAFKQSPCHMLTFMKVEGALHSLARHLTCKEPTLELLAVECCYNLSLGDTRTCFKLAEEVIPHLMAILKGRNLNFMNLVLLFISNLAGSGDKTCELLHSAGVLPILISILAKHELREKVARTITIFSKNACNYMSEAEVQEMVTEIVPYFEASNKVQWLIYTLSSHSYVIPFLIQQHMPIRVLHKINGFGPLWGGNFLAVIPLVRLLVNLSSDPKGVTACVILDNWSTTCRVVRSILNSNYSPLGKSLYFIFGNIFGHKSPEVQNRLLNSSIRNKCFERFLTLPYP